MRADAADKGITLVKNTLDQLPLNPSDHRRIRLYHLTGESGMMGKVSDALAQKYVEVLTERGYEVTINDGTTRVKGPTLAYRDEVDAALIIAETAAMPGRLEPWLTANAVVGLYAGLLELARDRVLAGVSGPQLGAELRRQGGRG